MSIPSRPNIGRLAGPAALILSFALVAGLPLTAGAQPQDKPDEKPRVIIPESATKPSQPLVMSAIQAWPYEEDPGIENMEVLRLLTDATFPVGSITLSDEAKGALAEASRRLKERETRVWHVMAVGMADSLNEWSMGDSLGEARAQALVDRLKALGVSETRLHTMGLGCKYAMGDRAFPSLVDQSRKAELWILRPTD